MREGDHVLDLSGSGRSPVETCTVVSSGMLSCARIPGAEPERTPRPRNLSFEHLVVHAVPFVVDRSIQLER